jgi:hypothetical protein
VSPTHSSGNESLSSTRPIIDRLQFKTFKRVPHPSMRIQATSKEKVMIVAVLCATITWHRDCSAAMKDLLSEIEVIEP